jgi:type IV secretory pathway TrbL component
MMSLLAVPRVLAAQSEKAVREDAASSTTLPGASSHRRSTWQRQRQRQKRGTEQGWGGVWTTLGDIASTGFQC